MLSRRVRLDHGRPAAPSTGAHGPSSFCFSVLCPLGGHATNKGILISADASVFSRLINTIVHMHMLTGDHTIGRSSSEFEKC